MPPVKLPLAPNKIPQNIKWYRPVAKNTQIDPQTTSSVANSKPIPPTVAYNSTPPTVANSKPMTLLKYANQTHQIKRAQNNIHKIEANIVKTRFYEILKRNRLKKQLSNQTQKMTNYQYQLAKKQAMSTELNNK